MNETELGNATAPRSVDQQQACYAAAWVVHTPSGPVPACDDHAGKIQALMSFMGAYTNITPAAAGEECSNCINESKRHNAEVCQPEGAKKL